MKTLSYLFILILFPFSFGFATEAPYPPFEFSDAEAMFNKAQSPSLQDVSGVWVNTGVATIPAGLKVMTTGLFPDGLRKRKSKAGYAYSTLNISLSPTVSNRYQVLQEVIQAEDLKADAAYEFGPYDLFEANGTVRF